MIPRPALVLASFFSLVAPARAQWDSMSYDSTQPVYGEGFFVAHDDGANLQVLSAVVGKFEPVAASGVTIEGTGDWTLLWKGPAGFRGYSARLHESALMPMPAGFVAVDIRVEDDVALVIGQLPGGGFQANAYSAETGAWAALPLASFADVVSSRFVIGLREGVNLHGFAARTGTWAVAAGGNVINPAADGNVATYERINAGDRRSIAFSGVLGVWAISPILLPGTATDLAHNVALGFERLGGGLTSPTSYSAYTGTWVTAPLANLPADFASSTLDDDVVLVERNVAPRFSAIGARPHAAWATINAANSTVQAVRESLIAISDPVALRAFSGLCGGTWVAEPYAAPALFATPSRKHVVVQDAANVLHAFSPARNLWAAPQSTTSPNLYEGDSVTVVQDGTDLLGYSTRGNNWTAGTSKLALVTYADAIGGSGFASQLTGTLGPKTVQFYNGRRGDWDGGFDTGSDAATWFGERNLLVADVSTAAGAMYGYSVQRGDFVPTTAPVAGPLSVPVTVEENVAWAVDAGGVLHAFASPGEVHAWYAWPGGSEFQAPNNAFGQVPQRLTLRGPGGGFAWVMYSLSPDFAGLTLAGVGGELHLGLPLLFSLFVGAIPADGLLEFSLPIPAGAPVCLQLWNQAVTLDAAFNFEFTEPAPEPSFVF